MVYQLFHLKKIEDKFPIDKFTMFIAIGYSELNKKREKVFNEAKDKGYELLSYVIQAQNYGMILRWEKNALFLKIMLFNHQ